MSNRTIPKLVTVQALFTVQKNKTKTVINNSLSILAEDHLFEVHIMGKRVEREEKTY